MTAGGSVTFTNTIVVEMVDSPDIDVIHLHVVAPAATMRDHCQFNGMEVVENHDFPLTFYIPEPYDGLVEEGQITVAHQFLVRGAFETLSEQSFQTYRQLVNHGISEKVARTVFPSNRMMDCRVSCYISEIDDFVAWCRDDPAVSHETGLVSRGYEMALQQKAYQVQGSSALAKSP